jgi:hypothetical protein
MDHVQPPTAGASPDRLLRCEDCGALRTNGEPGWVQVRYPARPRQEPDDQLLLYYCPVHAAQFDLRHPGVAPAFGS